MNIEDLKLQRSSVLDEYMTTQGMLHWDDPMYKYLFLGDYKNISDKRTHWGWHNDAFEICYDKKRIGYIKWDYDRRDSFINNICVFIEPEYIGKGYGAVALIKLIQYLFFVRNIRKISFSVCQPNVQALAMFRRFIKIAGREVGTKFNEVRLFDGTYCNAILFEVLKEDLANTNISAFYALVGKNEECYGKELILDLHGCAPETFNRASITNYFDALCVLIDMEKGDLHFWDDVDVPEEDKQTSPQTKGTSAVQFILTSSVTIHTLDLLRKVFVNIFSCKDFDREKARVFTEGHFEGNVVKESLIERI